MSRQEKTVQLLEQLNCKKEILLNCFTEEKFNILVQEIKMFLQERNLDVTPEITMDLIKYTLIQNKLETILKSMR